MTLKFPPVIARNQLYRNVRKRSCQLVASLTGQLVSDLLFYR